MRYFKIAQVAEIAGYSPYTIRRYIQTGEIAAHGVNGSGHCRIREKEVERFLGVSVDEEKKVSAEEAKKKGV